MQGTLNASISSNNAAYARIKSLEKKLEALTSEVNVDSSQIEAIQQEIAKYKADMSANVTSGNITATANLTSNGSTHLKTLTADERITAVKGIDAKTDIVVGKDESITEITGNKVQTSEISAAVISANGKVSAGRLETPEASINNLEVTGNTTINGTIAAVGKASFNDVDINHDLLFPRVDSNISGEYLSIHAKDAAFSGNLQTEGPAVIGGSLSVRDTLAAKNLIVVGEVLISNGLKLDAKTELTNPTFKGIKGTNELTTTALVIDNEGKLVSKKISSEVEGSVASSLVAQREVRTHTLLDEWKFNAENPIWKIPVSSTAQFVVKDLETTTKILLTNENGNQISVKELGVASQDEVIFSVAHKNFVYIIHPTLENGTTYKCVVIPINTNTMEVSPSFDITQYLGEISSGDIGESLVEVLFSRTVLQPLACGMVLPDDVPTIGFVGTNNYLDLSAMEIKTRDTAFSSNWCALSKNGNWIELPGYIVDNNFYCTNGKYSSVEDAALGVPASDYIVNPEKDKIEKQLFYVDAPVYGMHNENNLAYIDGGAVKEVAFADIGHSNYESIFGTVDKDGNPICCAQTVIYSGEVYKTSLFLYYGYYPREYFASTTVSYVDTIVIDKNKVEINGSTFVDGAWYDKVANSVNDLIDFITKPKDKKRYKVLFTGKSVELDTADTSQVPTSGYSENDIYGTFDIYHINDDMPLRYSLNLNGTPATLTRMNKLLDACHWHGFNTTADILFCSNTSKFGVDWVVKYLHINDCSLGFKTNGNAVPQDIFYLGISDSNNITYRTVDIPTALFTTSAGNKEVDVTLTNCYNVVFNGKSNSSSTAVSYYYSYSQILFDHSDRCEAVVNGNISIVSSQFGPGYNFLYNKGAGSGHEFVLPTVKNK